MTPSGNMFTAEWRSRVFVSCLFGIRYNTRPRARARPCVRAHNVSCVCTRRRRRRRRRSSAAAAAPARRRQVARGDMATRRLAPRRRVRRSPRPLLRLSVSLPPFRPLSFCLSFSTSTVFSSSSSCATPPPPPMFIYLFVLPRMDAHARGLRAPRPCRSATHCDACRHRVAFRSRCENARLPHIVTVSTPHTIRRLRYGDPYSRSAPGRRDASLLQSPSLSRWHAYMHTYTPMFTPPP